MAVMLSENLYETDFNFLDVLSSIGDIESVTSRKNTNANGDSNLDSFNFSFSVDSVPNYKSIRGIENDDLDDDLSALLDSCHVQKHQSSSIISLDALANDYLSNNSTSEKKHDKISLDIIVANGRNEISDEIPLLDCLEDIIFEEKCDTSNAICSENLLNTLQWEQSSIKDCGIRERNHIQEQNEETVEDEIIPDINLNFCIKKHKKDKLSPISTSPDSWDSGFDEIDFSSEKSDSYSSEETSSLEATFGRSNIIKPVLLSSKQSLLSRAVSAQPRTDKLKREKLQNIRKDLLKKCITKPVFEYDQGLNLKEYENIIDQSTQSVIKSSFLTIPGQ